MNSPDTAPQTQGQALPAGMRLEEFIIEKVLGAGGFGVTYLARDTALGRQVVIKENLPVQFAFRDPHSLTVAPRHSHGEDAENFAWSLENFSKEAAMLASLDHPGIVKVLRRFEAFGTAYFVMPFVEGEALDVILRRRAEKPFTEQELRGLLERVLKALTYLHERGVYHRDIKPGNILMTHEELPVLIDFGSARQRLSERSMTVVESAGYTPFEQLQSRGNVGPWSDLYALGATLTRLITRELPPKAMDRMRRDPFEPLADRPSLRDTYSHSLLSSIDKSLHVDEDARWQNAQEWLAALSGKVIEVQKEFMPQNSTPELLGGKLTSRPPSPHVKHKPQSIGSRKWHISYTVVVLTLLVHGGAILIGVNQKGSSGGDESDSGLPSIPAVLVTPPEPTAPPKVGTLQENAHIQNLASGKIGDELRFSINNEEVIVVKYVPGGSFQMGSPPDEEGRSSDEDQVWVTLSSHFWMGEAEVTQGQWVAVMGNNPSDFKDGAWKKRPVENLSWHDAQEFIAKVNMERPPGLGWKWALPTEAQWERACRGGTTTATAFGDSLSSREANFNVDHHYGGVAKGLSLQKTAPVKRYQPNAYALHDMHGNVWEWCADAYQQALPGGEDPQILAGSMRVTRGGGWDSNRKICRSSYRGKFEPNARYQSLGFRLAVVLTE